MSVVTTSIALIQLALSAAMIADLPAPDVASAVPEALERPARHRIVGAHPAEGTKRDDAMVAGEPDLSAMLPANRDPRLFRRDI